MYLFYATVVGDFGRVVEHWVLEDEWNKAIDVISRQVRSPGCWESRLSIDC
jgi:vacuolar protein sorting-associated protein 18